MKKLLAGALLCLFSPFAGTSAEISLGDSFNSTRARIQSLATDGPVVSSPRVQADIAAYDLHVATVNAAFNRIPTDPTDKKWVKSKLAHMVEVDQYMRTFVMETPFDQQYTGAEKQEFWDQMMPRWIAIDSSNTGDLKELLKIYRWFTISDFGKQADQDAWLLVQHADRDPGLQKDVLSILETLWRIGETNPSNYAYLFDRVRISFNDPTQRQPQRYGTQGECTGPGTWAPYPDEDPGNLDRRRKEVGLGPEADYIAEFRDICHSADGP